MAALPVRALRGRHEPDERGFSIFEVVVAVAILALLAGGMATTTNAGLGLVGTSKSRQTATQVAGKAMEEARATPYAALGLPSDTTFESGASNPDAAVNANQLTYKGTTEPLVYVATGSGVLHHEHENFNQLDYGVYRYVTWVTRGANTQAYKRVVVIVQWEGKDATGDQNRIELATVIGPNGIAWSTGGTTSTTAATTTTASTASTTTTIVPDASECPNPDLQPSTTMVILAGTGANQGYTNSSTISMSMTTASPCRAQFMKFSNDATTWSDYEVFATSKVWSLTPGNGPKTVYGRFKANNGKVTELSAQVKVDATPPTQPGSFAVAVLNSPKRMKLTWTASTDNDKLIGYYVFKKLDNAASFQNVTPGVNAPCSTSPCQFIDADIQSGKNYSYYVVAYDAAGNQSPPTETVQKRAS